MNPLNASWSILKNVGSADDFGDVSTSLDEQQQQKIEAIKRKNAEARKRLMQALKEGKNVRAIDFHMAGLDDFKPKPRHNPNEKDPESPVEIANIMDSKERIQELNPNAKNFADSSAPPVPQNNPNPLDLSMESLKRLNEGR